MDRVIVLVDMDCFYVQVEQRLNPHLKGKPCAVVQYNPWKGGGIIAVSYEARAFGVSRNMRGDDAKAKCPGINLVPVPQVRGKADLTKYREAGAEVIEVFSKFGQCVERASIDEAYIDLTAEVEKRLTSLSQEKVSTDKLPNSFVVGHDQNKDPGDIEDWLSSVFDAEVMDTYNQRLAVGAVIVEEMRAAVFTETGFRCSAGIAHNKMLAKLACGFHKPNKQTILPHVSVADLYSTLPIKKIRHLGGKMGQLVSEHFQVEMMGELTKFSENCLQQLLGDKNGSWLYGVCRGFDHEPVSARQLAKSIGCSKNFTGKNCLDTREKVKFWLSELAKEVEERLIKDKETNKRTAKSLTLSVRYDSRPRPVSVSRACAVVRYDAKKFAEDTFLLAQQFNTSPAHQASWSPAIVCLGISAGKFLDDSAKSIGSMFAKTPSTSQKWSNEDLDLEASQATDSKHEINFSQPLKKNVNSIMSFLKPVSEIKTKENIESNEVCDSYQANDINNLNELKKNFSSERLTISSPLSAFLKPINELNPGSNIQKELKLKESRTEHLNKSGKESGKIDTGDVNSKNVCFENVILAKSDINGQINQRGKIPVKFDDAATNGKGSIDMKTTDNQTSTGIKSFFARKKTEKTTDGVQSRDFKPYPADTSKTASLNNITSHNEQFDDKIEDTCLVIDSDDGRQNNTKYDVRSQDCLNHLDTFQTQDVKNQELTETIFSKTDAISPDNNLVKHESDDYMKCERCDQTILVWDMPEHMDFHFASDLQKDWNTQTMSHNQTVTSSVQSSSSKRKSSDQTGSGSKKIKLTNSQGKLDLFFSPFPNN